VAVAFAWAATAKVLRSGRWRRALSGHRLPPPLERAAVWGVPAVELAVLALAAAGRPRASAALALAALVAFTSALVRTALRGGREVPCGCFGREAVDVRGALARNAFLGALAVAAFVAAPADPPISAPTAGDAVPALLAGGALLAAAATAWRTSVWFSRGRG
jgi:hypothetical protein